MSTTSSRARNSRPHRLLIAAGARSYAVLGAIVLVVLVVSVIHFNALQLIGEIVDRYSPVIVLVERGQRLMSGIGYPGLVAIIFFENVFPPIPSDIFLPLAGYTAATTSMSFFGAVLATTSGSLLGAMALYGFGAWLGEARVRQFARRYGKYLTFEEDELDRSLAWFRRHGAVVVMVARIVPVFRSLISIPAGMSGMPLGRFLFFTALGAGAWNSGLISAGFLLGSNWETVIVWMDSYQVVMLSVNLGLFITIATVRVRTYRRRLAMSAARKAQPTSP